MSDNTKHSTVASSHSEWQFSVDDHWAQVPFGWTWDEVTAVAIDSQDRAFVFNRGEHPVMVFNRDGSFVTAWGEGIFKSPHGITIGPDDSVYCTDHFDHTVRKFTPAGELLLTLGISGQPSDTGATSIDFRTIRHAGPPFYFPTNLAVGMNGELFITDGYGNARIHKFAPDGKLLHSWGTPGSDAGQFQIPHGIAIDHRGVLFVADRENSRIPLFSSDGDYLGQWTDVARPQQVAFDSHGHVYVAELGYKAAMWPGIAPPPGDAPGGRVSVFDPNGKLLARWGGGNNPTAPGDFYAPHDVRVDSYGDVYVSEVNFSAGGNRGLIALDCHCLQKFTRSNLLK